jgi:hypothetical protein
MPRPLDQLSGPVTAEEVRLVARGIGTAVAPDGGLSDVQAGLLGALALALTDVEVDYHDLEPLGPAELATGLAHRDLRYRQRIVHHMVLGELVLRPLPVTVAHRVAVYAEALGVRDEFVRVARRYAQGAYGLAWVDLRRSGFVDHVRDAQDADPAPHRPGAGTDPFAPAAVDPAVAERWHAFAELPAESLGRHVWEMYDGRGFTFPGDPGGASVYLAQHDFVHVVADYNTNVRGELEVFAFIGRADPDPKGFAWLATLTGLFETGYIADTGFFVRDVRDRHVQASGMQYRIADAIRRGRAVCDAYDTDLFEVDYGAIADRPVDEVRAMLGVPAKSEMALESGSVGTFDVAGMSDLQQAFVAQRKEASTRAPQLHPDDDRPHR